MSLKQPISQRRAIGYVDVENLASTADFSEYECAVVRELIHNYLHSVAPGSPVVAACSHRAGRSVFGWPQARWTFRSGDSGADRALLDELDVNFVAARFTDVVIGSGDGIFAETAAELAVRGVTVHVVSRRRSLSRRLELSARVLHIVDDAAFNQPEADIA